MLHFARRRPFATYSLLQQHTCYTHVNAYVWQQVNLMPFASVRQREPARLVRCELICSGNTWRPLKLAFSAAKRRCGAQGVGDSFRCFLKLSPSNATYFNVAIAGCCNLSWLSCYLCRKRHKRLKTTITISMHRQRLTGTHTRTNAHTPTNAHIHAHVCVCVSA